MASFISTCGCGQVMAARYGVCMGGVLKRVFLGKVVSTRIPGRSFLRSWIKSGRFESKDGKDDPKVLKWLQLNRVCDSSHSCFF